MRCCRQTANHWCVGQLLADVTMVVRCSEFAGEVVGGAPLTAPAGAAMGVAAADKASVGRGTGLAGHWLGREGGRGCERGCDCGRRRGRKHRCGGHWQGRDGSRGRSGGLRGLRRLGRHRSWPGGRDAWRAGAGRDLDVRTVPAHRPEAGTGPSLSDLHRPTFSEAW